MSKKTNYIFYIGIAVVAVVFFAFQRGNSNEPWSTQQLMQPSELADKINSGKSPVIYNMGPSGTIKGAVDIGPAQEEANLTALRHHLEKQPKDAEVVVYCGCCPYRNCPNVRPAFALLTEMGFTNPKLLDLPQNLKANWIDEGYPMQR